tara:strand:+ start:554 stop:757 length:204 start_codon:yes stop_codon:yes gene_type:complete
MPKKEYIINVSCNTYEVWCVKASTEQEALDNYITGELLFTKNMGEDSEVVGEKSKVYPNNNKRYYIS